MTSFSKTSRPSSWTGWSGSPSSLKTMESIILNEATQFWIALTGVEKGGVVRTFWPLYIFVDIKILSGLLSHGEIG
jgi:hypothetical protein